MLTLGQAAKTVGLSKPTLSKAITRGHLSATRREDKSFAIDPAELMRWYEEAKHRFLETREKFRQASTPDAAGATTELPALYAALEAEVAGLKALLAEIRESRDDWKGQATRLALTKPVAAPPPPTEAIPVVPRRRGFWPFRRYA